jgi:hypothetical protein
MHLFAMLKQNLVTRLKRAVATLLLQYDRGLLRQPQVPRYLSFEIEAIGEELHDLAGRAALQEAIGDLDPRARSAVEKLWHGIG